MLILDILNEIMKDYYGNSFSKKEKKTHICWVSAMISDFCRVGNVPLLPHSCTYDNA
jgi:hypothetical protein